MGRQPCCDKVGLKRGPWTIEEDHKLMNFILNNGIQCWRLVPKLAGLLRCGKSCRLRWINYLRPDLKRGAFTEVEEDQIIQLHSRLGNRWSKIASHFPGRTDNEIKNHWNTRIKKKLRLLGIDPVTHKRIEEADHQDSINLRRQDQNDEDHHGDKTINALESDSGNGSQEKTSEENDTTLKNDFPGKREQIQEEKPEMGNSPWLINPEENIINSNNNNSNIINTTSNSCSNSSSISTWEEYSNTNYIINNNNNNPPLMEDYYSVSDSALQQWIDTVDPLLSWDCFNHLDDNFFLLGK